MEGGILVQFIQRGRNRRQKRREEAAWEEKGSDGPTEEEKAGTRLTFGTCRMHKAGTGQETRNPLRNMTPVRRHTKGRGGKRNTSTGNKCSSP